jgi:8-oxo-(d)GTP phosphatase
VVDWDTAGEIRAAGVVLWRPGGSGAHGVQVAVIHRPKYDDWGFPKGKLEPGEHVLRAAVRETAEETGLAVTLGRRLPHLRYDYRGTTKRVDYWAATADDASRPFTANKEVDRLDWLPVAEARMRLSYPHDVELLAEFSAGPAETVPLILLRHASAGTKSDWPGDDELRPLDAEGSKEAETLVGLLRCFGAIRVVSSPTERCLATIRPYARDVGTAIETEPALLPYEDSDAQPGTAARAAPGSEGAATLADTIAAAGQPVIVCAHRENLPVLAEVVYRQLGAPMPAGQRLAKAEFLVLHTAGGKLAGAERHHPGGDGLVAPSGRAGSAPIAGPARPVPHVARRLPVERGRQCALEDQQPALDLDPGASAVSPEPVAGQHPVARHDDRDRVGTHDLPDGAGGRNATLCLQADASSQRAVADRLPVTDRSG